MSPRPPSTAPSIRWPGPPNNDYAVRWRTAPAIWLGASRTSSGRPWPPRNRSRLASPAPQLAAGARLGGRLCRTGRPVVATVRSAERRPGRAGLCVNAGKCGTCWLGAPPWSWPRSAIDADRVDQMCAQSAAQSARRSVNWPAAHRIPMARRWLICTLYAACVRWSAARARCHGHPVTEPWSPGRMVAFGSPWLSLCTRVKRPRRGVSAPGGGLAPIPPPNREDETMQDTVDQAHSAMPRHPRRHQRGCTRGRVWATVGPDSRAWVCSFSKAT